LAQIILTPQCNKTLQNLAQHCNIVSWKWRHIWRQSDVIKMPFSDRQRWTFNKSFSKGKTWYCNANRNL